MTDRPQDHWNRLDDLMRELGAVRVEADDAKRLLTDDAIRDRIERILVEAATAVDDTNRQDLEQGEPAGRLGTPGPRA